MKKIATIAALSALTISAVPAASAAPMFGSSGSSNLNSSLPAPKTPEKQIRDAIEGYFEHEGYTVDRNATKLAQSYVTSQGEDRDQAYNQLIDSGFSSGSGGTFVSDPDLIAEQFPTEGTPKPDNGRPVAVGIDYGAVTTEIMVFFG